MVIVSFQSMMMMMIMMSSSIMMMVNGWFFYRPPSTTTTTTAKTMRPDIGGPDSYKIYGDINIKRSWDDSLHGYILDEGEHAEHDWHDVYLLPKLEKVITSDVSDYESGEHSLTIGSSTHPQIVAYFGGGKHVRSILFVCDFRTRNCTQSVGGTTTSTFYSSDPYWHILADRKLYKHCVCGKFGRTPDGRLGSVRCIAINEPSRVYKVAKDRLASISSAGPLMGYISNYCLIDDDVHHQTVLSDGRVDFYGFQSFRMIIKNAAYYNTHNDPTSIMVLCQPDTVCLMVDSYGPWNVIKN